MANALSRRATQTLALKRAKARPHTNTTPVMSEQDFQAGLELIRAWRTAGEMGARAIVVSHDGSAQLVDLDNRLVADFSDMLDAATAIDSETIQWVPLSPPAPYKPALSRAKAAHP